MYNEFDIAQKLIEQETFLLRQLNMTSAAKAREDVHEKLDIHLAVLADIPVPDDLVQKAFPNAMMMMAMTPQLVQHVTTRWKENPHDLITEISADASPEKRATYKTILMITSALCFVSNIEKANDLRAFQDYPGGRPDMPQVQEYINSLPLSPVDKRFMAVNYKYYARDLYPEIVSDLRRAFTSMSTTYLAALDTGLSMMTTPQELSRTAHKIKQYVRSELMIRNARDHGPERR